MSQKPRGKFEIRIDSSDGAQSDYAPIVVTELNFNAV